MKVSGSSYEVVENDILKCHCKMSLIAPPNLLLVCSAGCLLQCLTEGHLEWVPTPRHPEAAIPA